MAEPEQRRSFGRRVGRRAGEAFAGATERTGQAFARRVDALFSSGGPAFRQLAVAHASSTAGDTSVAVALAGTLFFSVPTTEARANVLLYLMLTIAPFGVLGPVLGRLLARFPLAYRHGLVFGASLRAVVAVWMIWRVETVWLYPLAFVLLVLSRLHGISRNSILPVALDESAALVAANARLARVGVYAGAVLLPVAAVATRIHTTVALIIAAVLYALSAIQGRRLPAPTLDSEAEPVTRVESLPREVRLAQFATAVVRLINGFLLLLLAFAYHGSDNRFLDFGALLAAAGAGFALSSMTAPLLERRLREEPSVLAALAIEAAAAFVAVQWFGLGASAALVAAAGFAWGTAKFAFDGLLQSNVRPEARGLAFTRSETAFQLAWVLGALVPAGIPIPARVGLVMAGLAALGGQVVYVAALIRKDEPPRVEDDIGGLVVPEHPATASDPSDEPVPFEAERW